jgi:hypothetical protein
MTLVPFTDCCAMLGIDAKTFRNWLRQANLAWVAHPKDARLKCLTREQVERLATLHARPLPSPLSPSPARAFAAPGKPESEAQPLEATSLLPTSVSPEADLRKQLSCLETKMTTMQEHLAQLALCLLGEREVRYEQRLRALEALVPQAQTLASFQTSQETDMAGLPDPSPRPARRLLPAEVRARSRVTALIEYGAHDQYVTVCPKLGVLSLVPDSPEWFDWLASLTAFRFVGPPGRFSACRASEKGQYTRRWAARRHVHGHDFWHYLGVTDRLTLASLEQAAAALQARVDAL